MCLLEGWSFTQGVYWAVVTACTVGYGTLVPTGTGSKWFASMYMLVVVGATGNILTDIMMLPHERHIQELEKQVGPVVVVVVAAVAVALLLLLLPPQLPSRPSRADRCSNSTATS